MIDFNYYLKKGYLKPQPANFKQINQQISRAEKDLITFSSVLLNDPEWAATIAYQAMLRAGRALLFSYGYLPADGQQHKTVVDTSGKILGPDFDLLVKQFEKLRRKRNVFFYDSEDSSNVAEAKKAGDTAKELIALIKENILQRTSQMKLKLK